MKPLTMTVRGIAPASHLSFFSPGPSRQAARDWMALSLCHRCHAETLVGRDSLAAARTLARERGRQLLFQCDSPACQPGGGVMVLELPVTTEVVQ